MIIDRGYGYAHLVELFDGETIPIEPGKVSINPFDLPPGEVSPDEEKRAFLLALIRAMVPSEGGAVGATENAILNHAISQTYSRFTSERRKEDGTVERFFAGAKLSDLARVLVTMEEIGTRPPCERSRTRHRAQPISALTELDGRHPLRALRRPRDEHPFRRERRLLRDHRVRPLPGAASGWYAPRLRPHLEARQEGPCQAQDRRI